MKIIDHSTTIQDLQANPKAYGLPTFQEFFKNISLFRRRPDEAMAVLDRGPTKFRKDLGKVKYKIHGVELSSQEQAETAILDAGYTLEDLEIGRDGQKSRLKYDMRMIPQGAGKYDVEVNFLP
jgi:hypothetical protein